MNGEGPASAEVSATPLSLPARPTGLTAAPGDGTVALAWDDAGDATITKHRVRRQALFFSGAWGAWEDIPDSADGEANETGYTVPNLTDGTLYAFQVQAVNSAGLGPASAAAVATPGVPAAPTGLSATPYSGAVWLAWTDPNDASIEKLPGPAQGGRRKLGGVAG